MKTVLKAALVATAVLSSQAILADDNGVAAGSSATASSAAKGSTATIVAAGHRRHIPDAGWCPYRPTETSEEPSVGEPLELTSIPYYAWSNRQDGSMRVWLPTA